MRRRLLSFVLLSLSLFSFAPVSFAATTAAPTTTGPLPTMMLESNIAYFKPVEFSKANASRIRPTFQQIAAKKPRGVIIDLRNNQGGSIDAVHALLESVMPKGTPYMRFYTSSVKRLAVTAQVPLIKKSTPIVVLRNAGTGNESDIVIYVLQKIRRSGVLEFTQHRAALQRKYKQNGRMEDYRPIKEAIFFVTPDVRVIGSEGADEATVIPRAISFIKELSPWDEKKSVSH